MEEPTGLKASSGIELLTGSTPNGYKATILLEELKAAYGLEYTHQAINISKNTQKEPWFTAINPNGRIPAIVDHSRGGVAVFEGSAILSYLTRHYDPEHKFSFTPSSANDSSDDDEYTVAEAWLEWQHGGLGPMQGQANHFLRSAKERVPYATQRYVGETERLYGILDARLADRDYVAGNGHGRFSIVDISLLGWANLMRYSGVNIDRFPNVWAWYERCMERPATKRAFNIPYPSRISNEAIAKKIADGGEGKEKEDDIAKFLEECQTKYNYKYTSP